VLLGCILALVPHLPTAMGAPQLAKRDLFTPNVTAIEVFGSPALVTNVNAAQTPAPVGAIIPLVGDVPVNAFQTPAPVVSVAQTPAPAANATGNLVSAVNATGNPAPAVNATQGTIASVNTSNDSVALVNQTIPAVSNVVKAEDVSAHAGKTLKAIHKARSYLAFFPSFVQMFDDGLRNATMDAQLLTNTGFEKIFDDAFHTAFDNYYNADHTVAGTVSSAAQVKALNMTNLVTRFMFTYLREYASMENRLIEINIQCSDKQKGSS